MNAGLGDLGQMRAIEKACFPLDAWPLIELIASLTLPGLVKIMWVVRPATKKRQVRNPATGEMVWAEAKPEKVVPKARVLKALKDMVVE